MDGLYPSLSRQDIDQKNAAALNHEILDDAMENRVVVMACLDVGNEIGDRLRGLFSIEFKGDDAMIGGEFDHCCLALFFGNDFDALNRDRRRPSPLPDNR